ncbi:SusC/RagA family TonB-linked outer membrane protein [Siphonobacter aquaeclarae]|uniref:TonB-linked outer membrane protein, SusC/RagA family n=1 Tax=Siphonobacter aquaeclarae TaxID=563176 RepID=A0A1G9N641_9BACT|nr:SusC/RagA family TonB-linked outer membrane protein [Siphonobacter aquaeclarae]SDL81864.1 TonB-linked outer membrane protein, SusC/RagA family [Siphonobacter aquaeclarae]
MKTILMVWATCVLTWVNAFAQDRIITGKVTSADDGAPLVGVTVNLKNTTFGTITDASGNYRIKVPSGQKAFLRFSFVGLVSQEIEIGTQSVVDVQLAADSKSLIEVVVTGTGTATSKKKLGIAVESITAEKLPSTPTASIDQALIGKIPGAQISSISGNPGDPVNIVLRGINTVQNGTKPLIMVDGVQIAATDLNSLDLSNVERVEVVQGAASAAIYGAQGANGVIQIFTKRGKAGAVAIQFSTSYSANQFINSGHVKKADHHPYLTDGSNNIINDKGQAIGYNDVGSIDYISYQYGGATRYAILDPRNVADKPYNANLKYYDHFKQMFQTGSTVNNSLSISGATDKSDYALSVSNNHTVTPIMKNGYVDRTNVSANLGTELFKNFRLSSNTQLIYTKNTLDPGLGANYGTGKGGVGTVYSFLNTSPFFDLRYRMADGSVPAYQTAKMLSINAFNPYYQAEYASALNNKVDILQHFEADYKPAHFLELNAKYGLNYRTENARWTYLNQSLNANSNYYESWAGNYASDNKGEIDNFQYTSTFQNFLATAFIKTDFERDFHLKVPIQTSTQITFDYRKNKSTDYRTYGLGLPLSPPIKVTSTSSQAVGLDYEEPFITYGYLINQKVDFGDFGGVTAGFRSDWSSAFGGGSKPFTFPHFDGYILPSSFWNGPVSGSVPYFKLRAAYGEAGIQPGAFDRYPILDQRNLGDGIVYSTQTSSRNPNLQVEVSKEFEAGTDFTVNVGKGSNWLNTINGSFSYWKRKSENVIYSVSVPPSTGATGQLTNAINMSSNGVQFQLNFPLYKSRLFNWDFTTNWSHQLSKIDAISGGADIILTSSAGSTALVLAPGQVIGQIYGFKALTSLDQKKEDGSRYISESDVSKYEVVNGRVVNKTTKGLQFTENTYSFGNPNPKFNASFINNLGFRDLVTLSFQLDWVYGSHLYNQTKEWMYRDGIHGDFSTPVTIDGKTAAYTAYYGSAYSGSWGSLYGAGNNATKDYFFEDASFLRLRNVSLGFELGKIFRLPYFKKCQLVLTGRNLFTVTKYTNFDPEVSSGTANSSYDRGVDNSTLPNIKSYQVGLNIGF